MKVIVAKMRLVTVLALASLNLACVPTIQTVYLTPEVKGKVLLFSPGEAPSFKPLTNVKAYHAFQSETATLSNQQGEYQLAPSSKVESTLLMAGHSLNYYPVSIQTEAFTVTALAQASTKMLDVETVNINSVIVQDELEGKPLLAEPGPSALKYCNLSYVKQLRRELAVHKVLKQSYPEIEPTELAYLQDQQQQTLMWIEYVKRSCNWENEDGYPRYRDMKDAREYFAAAEASLRD
ncbi:hypothetical protein [Agarivorans sp. Alg241-V36]|uniref:hypothetical protein n=1 Tax=Agarivorans sp. Alg241-V36 TaxID=2305992 RepID=UPI0013D181DD|nr:hypothetical protein [Agarivorans sp. Alg241-V36]